MTRHLVEGSDDSFYVFGAQDRHLSDMYWNKDGAACTTTYDEAGRLIAAELKINLLSIEKDSDGYRHPSSTVFAAKRMGSHINAYVNQAPISHDAAGKPILKDRANWHRTIGIATINESTDNYEFEPVLTVLADQHPVIKNIRQLFNAGMWYNDEVHKWKESNRRKASKKH